MTTVLFSTETWTNKFCGRFKKKCLLNKLCLNTCPEKSQHYYLKVKPNSLLKYNEIFLLFLEVISNECEVCLIHVAAYYSVIKKLSPLFEANHKTPLCIASLLLTVTAAFFTRG